MGRLATVAIITLAFAGATVQSFAADTAQSQPATSADRPAAGLPGLGAPPPPMPQGPMGWRGDFAMEREGWAHGPHRGMPPFYAHMQEMARNWGLFAPQADKKLSTADVSILAQATLLRHGYHEWKVTDVAAAADGAITFAYATADGSVIARFSVDPHNGRFTRIG